MTRYFLLLLCLQVSLWGSTTFHIQDLSTLENQSSVATSINESGQVVGAFTLGEKRRAFFWDPNNGLIPTYLTLSKKEFFWEPKIDQEGGLITASEGEQSWISSLFCSLPYQPGYWTPENGSLERPVPRSWGKNRVTIVASNLNGEYIVSDKEKSFFAVLHEGQYHKILKEMFDDVQDMNNSGKVIGTVYKEIGNHKIPRVAIYSLPEDKHSTVPLKWKAFGRGINDHGDIIGVFENEAKGEREGFLLTHDKKFIPLGAFHPTAINNQQRIIGEKLVDNASTPFLYKEGRLINLNYVCHIQNPQNPWQKITRVYDINDQGQIVGKGLIHFAEHAVLLTPDHPLSAKEKDSPEVSGLGD